MPYYPRRNYRGRRSFRRRVQTQKPTAYNQKKQISSLYNRVSRINRQVRHNTSWSSFKYQVELNYATDLAYPYKSVPLVMPNDWTTCFETSAMLHHRRAYKIHDVTIQTMLNCYNEVSPVSYTVYLCMLRPGFGARALLASAGEDLASLTDNTHYTKVGGLALMSKNHFKILRKKTFTIGAEHYDTAQTAGRAQQNSWKRWEWKLKMNKWLCDGSDGNVTDMANSNVPPGTRLYMIFFNDNVATDLESNEADINCVFNVKS